MIFYKKKDNYHYKEQYEKTVKSILYLIKNSKTKKGHMMYSSNDDDEENDDRDNKYSIIFAFKLFNKLAIENNDILKVWIEDDVIDTLIDKIGEHKKPIRDIIYDTLLYAVKKTDEYKKQNIDHE